MPDHNNLRSAQLASSARLTPPPELLPAAEVSPASQMPSLPSAFLPVSVQQPVVLPDNRDKIPVDKYPFDTLPLYNSNDRRSLTEQSRTLPCPIKIWCGMNYQFKFQQLFMLKCWIKGLPMSASNINTLYDDCKKEKLKSGSMTFPIAWEFNNSLAKEKARLDAMILAEMREKKCRKSCHHYPQRPTKAANGQDGVLNGHGEGLQHRQRGESSTARAGPQQPTPRLTPVVKTVGGINERVAQSTTPWENYENSLLAQIYRVKLHGINGDSQQSRDLQQVVAMIDNFVLEAKHRVLEIKAVTSDFWAAVNNPNGNAPAANPCAKQYIMELTSKLLERLTLGLLKILVPLFTFHPEIELGTTEALLMLRIEGCKRGWIPFLTDVLMGAVRRKAGAEEEYLEHKAFDRRLWPYWKSVLSGNKWAIHAIANPRRIPKGLGTSSLKVYLMPMGWDGQGWKGLKPQIGPKFAVFPPNGVQRMLAELLTETKSLSATSSTGSGSNQQPGGYNNHHNNNHHNSNLYQMSPMLNAGNYGQQPQQSGNGYGFGYTPPQVPPPNGHKRLQADSYDGPSGCGCGCGAKYGCGRASGSSSGSSCRKRRREED